MECLKENLEIVVYQDPRTCLQPIGKAKLIGVREILEDGFEFWDVEFQNGSVSGQIVHEKMICSNMSEKFKKTGRLH